MKAVILAAGQSKRLRPLTEDKPKCMLLVRGKPLLDYHIEALMRNGITEIVVIVGYKKEIIITHLKLTYPKLSFSFVENNEYTSTGAAYSLWLARDHFRETVLCLHSDVLYRANIIKRIRKHPHATVTAIQRVPWDEEQVNVVTDSTSRITEIGKQVSKERSYGEFIGVTKFDRSFALLLIQSLEKLISSGNKTAYAVDAVHSVIQQGGDLYALDITDLKTFEIDTPTDLAEAEKSFGMFEQLRHNHHFWSVQGFKARVRRMISYFFDQRLKTK
jgi:choline kinase